MRPRLRIFRGDDDCTLADPPVSVKLSELTRVLLDAAEWDRTWMQDFSDDDIQVPADLYEIISHYTHLRPSA